MDGVTGAEVADGVDECIKAVRRQIGAGADWIKVCLQFGSKVPPTTVLTLCFQIYAGA